eukprot:4109674-Pyramimonas_sp.AAC.1
MTKNIPSGQPIERRRLRIFRVEPYTKARTRFEGHVVAGALQHDATFGHIRRPLRGLDGALAPRRGDPDHLRLLRHARGGPEGVQRGFIGQV